jgi:aspartyl/glutamyl-tRNA(Asn/Gln) amidotransferase C subunit
MTYISREEIAAVARGSQLEILSSEIEPLIQQIQDVLTYAARVTQIATDLSPESAQHAVTTKNINVFRADYVQSCDAELLLERAPEREGTFFVVPVILEHS